MEKHQEDNGSLEARSPGGWEIKAHGRAVVIGVMLAIATGLILFVLYDHESKAIVRGNQNTMAIQQMTARMEEVAYVLTLDERQRKELKLDMPESLRRRTR